MSKHETWRTREFWHVVGGLLIEEFHAIKCDRKQDIGKRAIDGVIVLGEPHAVQTGGSHEFEGKDLIVIQTKSGRLGMYLMGQAYFSREIMRRFNPKSVRTVAICGQPDPEMASLCVQADIEVCVIPDHVRTGSEATATKPNPKADSEPSDKLREPEPRVPCHLRASGPVLQLDPDSPPDRHSACYRAQAKIPRHVP